MEKDLVIYAPGGAMPATVRLGSWIEAARTAPMSDLALWHAQGRPRLYDALKAIEHITLDRMKADDSQKVPIVDPATGEFTGQSLEVKKENVWTVNLETLKEAVAAFTKDGLGHHPDVLALYRRRRFAELTDEDLVVLGIKEEDLLKLGDRYRVVEDKGGVREIQKAMKLGKDGGKWCAMALKNEPGDPKLKIEGKVKAEPQDGDWAGKEKA